MKKLAVIILLLALAAQAQAQYVAQDPTRYIPNARILGLGKAYIGLAEDVGSIYTNPAGLSGAKGWQLSSMSGKFLDEYSYLSFSGLYPTDYGVFGVGFAGTSIAGAFATTIEAGSDPDDPIYTIDLTQPEMGNYNNAFVLSYGNEAKKINYLKRLPYTDRLSIGANLKLFRTSIYGDGITGGDASGTELDLGMKFQPPQPWMKFGVAAQNVLPFAMGGKLTYTSGHEESYPAVIEVGSAFQVLGKKDALRRLGEHELTLAADVDMHPTLTGYPMTMHLGVEWRPIPLIAIRGGIDQDAAGDGAGALEVVSDPTYGVGLYFGGFRFDYAYHGFAGAPNIDNHFFSLSYTFEPPPAFTGEAVVILLPPDKHITFEGTASVMGRVRDESIRMITINNSPLKFSLRGEFSTTLDLAIGKNRIEVKGMKGQAEVVGSAKARVLRLQPFPDVYEGYWVRQPISLLAMQKIITGYPDGTFRPEGNITRAEMCTLLMKTRAQARTLGSDTSEAVTITTTRTFSDVAAKHWAAKFVAEAAALGVVKGYPDGTFRPSANITRAEGLAMVARFAGVSQEAFAGQFPDVMGSHWAASIISGAYNAGLLEYLKGQNFELNRVLSRAETVEMLHRTQYVNDLLAQDLLNWETY